MTRVFIDGAEGTTGLKIFQRFENRKDIELIKIDPELRKDTGERKRLLNEADIVFLCLPDLAAKEAVELIENPEVKIIDTSTAHRTKEGWAYGFPELSVAHKKSIAMGKRIAVPGCHATGFNAIVYPLVKEGIMGTDYPVSCFSVTGYSGGGKSMIKTYSSEERPFELESPRQYGIKQEHKHLKEMKLIPGLQKEPLFSPIVADFYSGMTVTIPLFTSLLNKKLSPEELREFFADYYGEQKIIKVLNKAETEENHGFIGANTLSGKDTMEIIIEGNDERLIIVSRLDNLGKGASGAAMECMNIILGLKPEEGLII
ncbi:MAG: N-acetyl-gamma-glutamyl-phosphate reductase [Clostridiaceae bacterium]